jgi:hypothetical protein
MIGRDVNEALAYGWDDRPVKGDRRIGEDDRQERQDTDQ